MDGVHLDPRHRISEISHEDPGKEKSRGHGGGDQQGFGEPVQPGDNVAVQHVLHSVAESQRRNEEHDADDDDLVLVVPHPQFHQAEADEAGGEAGQKGIDNGVALLGPEILFEQEDDQSHHGAHAGVHHIAAEEQAPDKTAEHIEEAADPVLVSRFLDDRQLFPELIRRRFPCSQVPRSTPYPEIRFDWVVISPLSQVTVASTMEEMAKISVFTAP